MQPQSLASAFLPIPHLGRGQLRSAAGRAPFPQPRLRFPQTGSSGHTQAWGWDQPVEPGSGAWQARGMGRERDRDLGQNERDAEMQRKTRETEG